VDGAKLLHAYCYARIPRFTVILRKAYGGAFIVLGSRSIGSDYAFAWEGAEIGVMGAKGAVEILYRKVLLECEDPEGKARELEERFSQEILDPREALRHGTIDAVIQPEETRSVLMNLLLTYRPSSSQSTILPL
jgi:acetyl-CoA carboxylase carboxyltransferase component